jgi:N4-(beta-N-acetylglucosaminyl)-L-asparaginase
MKRRSFLKAGAIGLGSSFFTRVTTAAGFVQNSSIAKGPLIVSSYNGLPATKMAMKMIIDGADAIDAVISGVNIVEDDPEDMSVGFGGLPNEEGVVELDSCCMHGPTHNAGAVAAIQNIKNPSKVAKLVMDRTDHVLLAGRGALKFAKAHGFKEENLLTEKARKAWLKWKENRDNKDDWFPAEMDEKIRSEADIPFTYGTITCLALDLNNNISGVTTTSGLSYKIPGRIGDSPIIGAGLYVDNEVGACGSTGRGEENLKNLTSFLVVEFMRQGLSPLEACKAGIRRVIKNAIHKSLIKENGKPNFNIRFYALNKKGDFGSASIYGPHKFSVHDGKENSHHKGHYLYEV